MGKPSGTYIYPLIEPKDGIGLAYQYNQFKGTVFTPKFYQELLVVSFNKENIVTDVRLDKTGEK